MAFKDEVKKKEYLAKYYRENKERLNALSKEWYKNNTEHRATIMKKHRINRRK